MHDFQADDGAAADNHGLLVPSKPRSVALMRQHAVRSCTAMGWAAHADTVALLVSEVAGNAVLHACGPQVGLRVIGRGRRLRVEVWDDSPELPVLRRAGERAENGRGLLLVEALSAEWGVERQPDGKVFWFELAS
jgi:anti-sigma regulatory factor (Ser/Thr protein kinase)